MSCLTVASTFSHVVLFRKLLHLGDVTSHVILCMSLESDLRVDVKWVMEFEEKS